MGLACTRTWGHFQAVLLIALQAPPTRHAPQADLPGLAIRSRPRASDLETKEHQRLRAPAASAWTWGAGSPRFRNAPDERQKLRGVLGDRRTIASHAGWGGGGHPAGSRAARKLPSGHVPPSSCPGQSSPILSAGGARTGQKWQPFLQRQLWRQGLGKMGACCDGSGLQGGPHEQGTAAKAGSSYIRTLRGQVGQGAGRGTRIQGGGKPRLLSPKSSTLSGTPVPIHSPKLTRKSPSAGLGPPPPPLPGPYCHRGSWGSQGTMTRPVGEQPPSEKGRRRLRLSWKRSWQTKHNKNSS